MPRSGRRYHADGFTLVEPLVVIAVIGVLAGIAVPVLLGQRDSATHATYVDLARDDRAVVACQTAYSDALPTSFTGDATGRLDG